MSGKPSDVLHECVKCFNHQRPGELGWISTPGDGGEQWICPYCSGTLPVVPRSVAAAAKADAARAKAQASQASARPEAAGSFGAVWIVLGAALLAAGFLATVFSSALIFHGLVFAGVYFMVRGIYCRAHDCELLDGPASAHYAAAGLALLAQLAFTYYFWFAQGAG